MDQLSNDKLLLSDICDFLLVYAHAYANQF